VSLNITAKIRNKFPKGDANSCGQSRLDQKIMYI